MAKVKGSPKTGGRKKGTLNKRTEFLRAIEVTFDDGETGFWTKVAELAKQGDSSAINLFANRLIPALKPISQTTAIELGSDNLFQDARSVLTAIGTGQIPVDVGTGLLTAINSVAKTQEIADLEDRIRRLEKQ